MRGSLDCQARIKRNDFRARFERDLGETASAAACFMSDLSFNVGRPASRGVEAVRR
jgi:hypothetical protein